MLRILIVAAFALVSIPALAQQRGGSGGGGGSVTGCETSGTGIQKGNGSGGCAAAATSDLHALSAQLTSAATNGDGNYTIAATTFRAATSAALTAPRVWTLPAAASVNAGDVIVVSDDAGGVSATNTLTISRAGSDTINGGASAVINAAYGALGFKSNGSNAWTLVDGARLQPITCLSHEWMAAVASTGTITCTQPASGDISGLGSIATQSAGSVAITGGTINATAIGQTTAEPGSFTSLAANGSVTFSGLGSGTQVSCLGLTSSNVLVPSGSACGSGGGGGVSSVGLSLPSIFTVSGSPVTGSGTLAGSLATEAANTVFAGPSSGSAAAPTFRALVGADLPNPSTSTLGGVQSVTCSGSEFVDQISTSGVPGCAAPSGGSGGPAFHPGFQSGQYYTTPAFSNATFSLSGNTLYAVPFYAPTATTFSKESIDVTTTGTATACDLGLYANNNGVPSSLIEDSGSVSVAATGSAEITGATINVPAGWSFLVANCNGSATVEGAAAGGSLAAFFLGFVSQSSAVSTRITSSSTYGPLPSSFGTVSYGGGGSTLLLYLRL